MVYHRAYGAAFAERVLFWAMVQLEEASHQG